MKVEEMNKNKIVESSRINSNANAEDLPSQKPRRNSILKTHNPAADKNNERQMPGHRERRTSWADTLTHKSEVQDFTQEHRNNFMRRTSIADSYYRSICFSPQILSRLKKIRENFRVYDNCEHHHPEMGPGLFCTGSPQCNRRYFLQRGKFTAAQEHSLTTLDIAGPIVTKMNISPRKKCSPRTSHHLTVDITRKRSRNKLDLRTTKMQMLKHEIMEDITWCINQFEYMMNTKHEEEHDKLKSQMSAELNSLSASKVNSERSLALYLKDFMGLRPDLDTSLSVHQYQFDIDEVSADQDEKVVSINPKLTFQVMMNNWDNFVKNEPMGSILADRHKWGLDVFKVSEHTQRNPLITLVLTVMRDWGFQTKFKISNDVLVKNLMEVESLYRAHLPYHNSLHAADIFISSHVILSSRALENIFTDLEIFATLYGAATHDIDHPGVTNQYLIKTRSKISALYNDRSVLEHHHISQSLSILNTDEFNILKNLKSRDVRMFKSIMSAVILATDAAHHTTLLTDLKIIAETKNRFDTCSMMSDDKLYLLQSIVHCCDIGNPLKPLDQYQNWVDRIMTEFFRQGDIEKSKNLEPSPMCDRYTTNIPKCQVGFIDHIVRPIWKTLAEIISPDADELLLILERNREFYVHHTIPLETILNMGFSNYSSLQTDSSLSSKWGVISTIDKKSD